MIPSENSAIPTSKVVALSDQATVYQVPICIGFHSAYHNGFPVTVDLAGTPVEKV